MQVSPFVLRALCAHMREIDGTTQFLAESGLTSEQLESAHGLIDVATATGAIRVAYAISKDPALGLRLGASLPPQTTVVLGALFAACPTLRSAIDELTRYLPLIISDSSLALYEKHDTATLVLELPPGPDVDLRFAFELTFSWLVCVSRQFIGEHTAPAEVLLPYARPDYADEYAPIFRCPIGFGAPRGEIRFDRARLDMRQLCSDQQLVEVLKVHAESLLLRHVPNRPVHSRVRAVLREERRARCEGGFAFVREHLGLSGRSLARLLAREGHSFSALRDQEREREALRALLETDVPIKAIAENLGFSELSPFYRAFKRWTNGMTPHDYRRTHRAPLLTAAVNASAGRSARAQA